jgi:hypothetical protein
MKYGTKIVLTIFLIGLFSCKSTTQKTVYKASTQTDEFIRPDLRDSNYTNFNLSDTTTVDDWSIKYLVKNDSTKYSDIYISCTKGDKTVLYFGKDLLQYRGGFIPQFIGETNSYLYFWHRCATDCQSILVCSKDSVKFTDYSNVADFNIKLGQILYVPDRYYEDSSENFRINLMNLTQSKEYVVTFDGQAHTAKLEASVDSVLFDKKEIIIKAEILKNRKVRLQTKTIKF